MNEEPAPPNYAAYWRAALARHRALIAAGCISPVGVKRVSVERREEAETDDEQEGHGNE